MADRIQGFTIVVEWNGNEDAASCKRIIAATRTALVNVLKQEQVTGARVMPTGTHGFEDDSH